MYCLALMQHHGAPTRLLDWSYSPFVAAKFAIEAGGQNAVVWCMSPSWCHSAVTTIVGEPQTAARNTDLSRNDISFRPMYGVGSAPRRKFAYVENPLQLNPRLSVQQGVFLCPGDIGAPFVDNLSAMVGFDAREHVLRLRFKLDATATHDFARALRRMNLSSAALFPGLDGFARSLAENLFLYKRLGED